MRTKMDGNTVERQSDQGENSLNISEAMEMIYRATELCFSNKFIEAKDQLEPWVNQSIYHSVAYSCIMCVQALLKFEQEAINKAHLSIKLAMNVCERHRKRPSWSETFSSWIWTSSSNDFTEEEKHAELCYTECLLLDALLTFIQDDNIVSFVWGAFKIRSCYQNYKTCLEMVTNTGCSTSQSSLVKDFENGIHLGIGGFNLVLSLLPPIIIKLLEWVGFSGDRFLGLKHLHKGSKGQSLRSPLCSLLLLAYHTWISQYLGNGDGDMEYSEQALLPLLTAYPKGSIFIFFDGRIKQVWGRLDEAISRYKHSITLQSEIKQFHHIFYWELMWCLAYKGDWVQASHYAGVLLDESLWSKTVYMHLNASFMVMARLVNQPMTSQQEEMEKDLFKRLPGYKRQIGGQCLPFEDFAIHRANKYFKQNGRLFLPGVEYISVDSVTGVCLILINNSMLKENTSMMELIYLWNGFKVLGHRPDLVEPLMNLVENSLHKLHKAKDDYGSYLDDWCLGKLLQAMCCRCLNRKREAMEYLKGALSRSKDLSNDSYLAPYTCAEIGFLYLEEGDLELAREHLERARKHQDHLLQSLLHLRIHAALQKIENYSIQNELFGVGGEFARPNQALVIKEDLEESGNESEFFDAEEDWDDCRPRQDSNSSFDIISDDELDTIIS